KQDADWARKSRELPWTQFCTEWNALPVLQGGSTFDQKNLQPWRDAISNSFLQWSLGYQENLLGRLHSIPCPVLWITGERDVKFTSLAQRAIPKFGNGSHATIAHAGHRVHVD